jgi:predicted outer membrane repeat protein
LTFINGRGVGQDNRTMGGAIYNAASKSLTITNCTFTGNSSINNGGAIASYGTVNITHGTFSGNFIGGNGLGGYGGAIALDGGTLTLAHSIVAGNTAVFGPDIHKYVGTGVLAPLFNNLIGKNSTVSTEFASGVLVGTQVSPLAPLLTALGSYGGRTQTMPPQTGSPAIDTATGSGTSVDQRGLGRPQGTARDLGAVDRGASNISFSGDPNLGKVELGASKTFNFTIVLRRRLFGRHTNQPLKH